MNPQDIHVIIVSYNGQNSPVVLARKLARHVGHVHIVDNGSTAASRAILEGLANQTGLTIEFLPVNMGIAYALNKGLAHAAALKKSWVLTMDQDSMPDDEMVFAFCSAAARSQKIRCMSPVISDRGKIRRNKVQVLSYAITSGNLVHMEVYQKAGTYRESLFIDGVDFDFSLRVRQAGFKIHLIPEARLYHHLGDEKPNNVLMKWYTVHSPVRRYYKYRNLIYLLRWHGLRFPIFAMKTLVAHGMLLFMVLLHDPSPRTSFRFIVHGLRDALRGRTGRIPEALTAA